MQRFILTVATSLNLALLFFAFEGAIERLFGWCVWAECGVHQPWPHFFFTLVWWAAPVANILALLWILQSKRQSQ